MFLNALGDRGGGVTLSPAQSSLFVADTRGTVAPAAIAAQLAAQRETLRKSLGSAGPLRLKDLFHVNAQYSSAEQLAIQQEIFRVLSFNATNPDTATLSDRGGMVGAFTYGQMLGGPVPTTEDVNFAAALFKQRPDLFQPKSDWMDTLSKVVSVVVEAIVIAGVAYGAYLAAAQASGAASASASSSTGSAAASDAGTLYAPSGAAVPSSAVSPGVTASGLTKTAAGYVSQAKTLYGAALAVKAAVSKPAAPAQSLDTSYGGGSGSGGGAGGFGSGNSLYYIGGAVLAVLFAATLLKKKGAR